MNISSRYSGLSGSAKHVKSQIAVARKDDTVHAILEEVEEWKQKKLFWRFSDLGRRHVKLVYYFAPIKSEIFYNSDCYERVRKFVILKVHRIAIFFFTEAREPTVFLHRIIEWVLAKDKLLWLDSTLQTIETKTSSENQQVKQHRSFQPAIGCKFRYYDCNFQEMWTK